VSPIPIRSWEAHILCAPRNSTVGQFPNQVRVHALTLSRRHSQTSRCLLTVVASRLPISVSSLPVVPKQIHCTSATALGLQAQPIHQKLHAQKYLCWPSRASRSPAFGATLPKTPHVPKDQSPCEYRVTFTHTSCTASPQALGFST
jgi:hypothetical protein